MRCSVVFRVTLRPSTLRERQQNSAFNCTQW